MSSRLSRRHVLGLLPASAALTAFGCRSDEPIASANASVSVSEAKPVKYIVTGTRTVEGAGVHLTRTLGSHALDALDPFLLLDDIHTNVRDEYAPGFPTHPHRGFETVTYMIEGAMEHRDSIGNHGRLAPGSAQWMTAGHGIVHSEMPKQDAGALWGLQLWVNLPRDHKMMTPRYQDIAPDAIPELSIDGARVRLVAGAAQGETGPVSGIIVAPTMLDVALDPGQSFAQPLPRGQTAFVYVLDGAVEIGPKNKVVTKKTLAVLGDGAAVIARGATGGGRMLLLAGNPIGEPIARSGPFVMNTKEELDEAWAEYRNGTLTQG